jgi:hypothetical protein
MNFDKASKLIILACLLGLALMLVHVRTNEDWPIPLLLVPIAIMIYAKKVNREEIEDN